MKTHARKLWDFLKSSYWFVPLVMMGLAIVVWLFTSTLDHLLSSRSKRDIAWLYLSDEDSMRTLLLTIAGAIVGILGVVFSIIMIPLSIAASQFGPRLLRTFLRDTGTQVTLGTFTATFIFCMAVLLQLSQKAVHSLPQISINVALLLGLISFAVLIFFINHVAISIQAPVVVARVSKELHTAIDHELPNSPNAASAPAKGKEFHARIPEKHTVINAIRSGYVQVRDDDQLMQLAKEHNIVLQLMYEPGDFIVTDTPIALVWPAEVSTSASDAINSAFVLGSTRTLVQDVTFGINELVEVAVRALSPAINDPFTAMTCLDWLGSALTQICSRKFPEQELYDNEGNLRVIRNPITFTSLADAAFNQIRENANSSTVVTMRLINTIRRVAQQAQTDEQRLVLWHHATLVHRSFHSGVPGATDRESIFKCYEDIKEVLRIQE